MINSNQHIPAGYKHSTLGIIPEDWEVKRLGDLCENKGDYGLNAPATDYSDDLPTYLRITDIDDSGNFIHSTKKSVDNLSAKEYYLKDGDIVFARTGATVGKTYLYNVRDGQLVYAGFLIKFSPNPNKLIPYYLKAHTETKDYMNWVAITSQRSGQPGINAAEYCSLKLAIPPIEEQERICNVLQLWDTAIEKQTALIEQLTLRKRGLMQQLLTGKKRLKGFGEDWKTIELGDALSYIQPTKYLVVSENYNNTYNTPVLTAGKTFILGYTDETTGVFNDLPAIIFDDFTTESKYVTFPFKAKSSAMKILKAHNSNLYFMFCAMQMIKYSVGGHERHWISKFSHLTLKVPSLKEQNAIASVLVNADKEIEIQKQKLAAMQEQKKGLMQVLLTGRKRINK